MYIAPHSFDPVHSRSGLYSRPNTGVINGVTWISCGPPGQPEIAPIAQAAAFQAPRALPVAEPEIVVATPNGNIATLTPAQFQEQFLSRLPAGEPVPVPAALAAEPEATPESEPVAEAEIVVATPNGNIATLTPEQFQEQFLKPLPAAEPVPEPVPVAQAAELEQAAAPTYPGQTGVVNGVTWIACGLPSEVPQAAIEPPTRPMDEPEAAAAPAYPGQTGEVDGVTWISCGLPSEPLPAIEPAAMPVEVPESSPMPEVVVCTIEGETGMTSEEFNALYGGMILIGKPEGGVTALTLQQFIEQFVNNIRPAQEEAMPAVAAMGIQPLATEEPAVNGLEAAWWAGMERPPEVVWCL